MYFMYTRYLDLAARHPAEQSPKLDFQMIMIQNERDAMVKKSILDHHLGYFPKSKKEFEKVKINLEDMSKILHDQLVFFFSVRDEQKSPERECLTLHKGIWKKYMNTTDAINEIYNLKPDERKVDIHMAHYPKKV